MSMLNHMKTIQITTKIKTVMMGSTSSQKTNTKIITINRIIISILSHLKVRLNKKMKNTLSFLDKNNKNKAKLIQLIKLIQMIFSIKLIPLIQILIYNLDYQWL